MAHEIGVGEALACYSGHFTDACIFAPVLNIPMVICGPGLPVMAHQPDEYVDLPQVAQAAEVFARAAADVLRVKGLPG